ncbi:hypothetical protein [Telluribacter humicola]|uniref:hypothetical protein n=1 Tax=Telluribacter humicola TaxID=1720261 RepID=UPI001A957104|nr:hypothetical protein [Telluribacter humicola]
MQKTLLTELTAWLEKPQYWPGVQLYETYGSSAFLKKLFRSSEDDYNRKKLTEELTKLLDQYQVQEQAVLDSMPTELTNKLEVARRLMDERSALKERLRVYDGQKAPAEQMKAAAFEILAINDQLDEIYAEERFFRQVGHLPEKTDFAQDSVEWLMKRRLTLRTYVSRYRSRPDKLQEYQNELFQVEQKLQAHGIV